MTGAEIIGYLKSFHIIFVVTWFAGLFYVVRLFIYFIEAQEQPELERKVLQNQYKIMMKRLWYIITWPSMVLAIGFAIGLLIKMPTYLSESWMHAKITFVALLVAYHFACGAIHNKLQNNIINHTSFKMRLWNEVATLLLFAIVFLVVLKSEMNALIGVAGFILLAVILMIGIKIYKRSRLKKGA
jgi:putative membrane protein|tara:strand:+ start:2817 stop:3371 length:555 start_codon:yes stop_codon:yes gene_type:complete